jgi:hypothetical protein
VPASVTASVTTTVSESASAVVAALVLRTIGAYDRSAMAHRGAASVARAGRAARVRGSVALCLVLGACEPLPALDEHLCGNAVIAPAQGEACDTFAPEGLTCGGPGQVGACRYLCDVKDPKCPPGQRCGTDGICREHSGIFEEPVLRGSGVDELAIADLDADGRLDLMATTDREVQLLFGAGSTEEQADLRQALDPLFLPVTVARSDETDPGAELLVPRWGFVSLRTDGSGSNRQLTPAELPALRGPEVLKEVMLLSGDCPVQMKQDDLLLFASGTGLPIPGLEGPINALLAANGWKFVAIGTTLGPPSKLAGPIVTDRFGAAAQPGTSCRQVALAYKDLSEVEVFTPFTSSGANQCPFLSPSCPPEMRRRVAVGAPVGRGPFAVRANADDYLDLLVQIDLPPGSDGQPRYELRVAYGVADGSFHSDLQTLPASNGDDTFSVIDGLLNSDQKMLAAGDLDGNGTLDFVTHRGIMLDGQTTVAALNAGSPWTEAVIADLNANAIPDVLAVDDTNSQAFFFNGMGGGILSSFTIETQAPLSQLRAGDFDGDTLGDVVAVANGVRRDSAQSSVNEVSILFGQPAGPPKTPLVVGYSYREPRLSTGLLASDMMFGLGGARDGASDIMASSAGPSGAPLMSTFIGRGDREIRSPLALVDVTGSTLLDMSFDAYVPRRVVAGHFKPDDPTDPAAPARPGSTSWRTAAVSIHATRQTAGLDFRLWLLPELGSEPDLASIALVPEPIQTEATTVAVAVWELGMFAALDLDGDARDELVAVAPLAADGKRSAYRIGDYDEASGAWQWWPQEDVGLVDVPLFRNAGPTVPCRDPFGFPDDWNSCPADSSVNVQFDDLATSALDLPDVNGRMLTCQVHAGTPALDDLVVLSRPAFERDDPEAPNVKGELRVYLNDGNLSLSTEGFRKVGGLDALKLYDVACLQADTDPQQEIVVLTNGGLYRVDFDTLTVTELTPWLPPEHPYRRMVAGDVDGDGLDDLALGSPDQTVVLRALPVLPDPERSP